MNTPAQTSAFDYTVRLIKLSEASTVTIGENITGHCAINGEVADILVFLNNLSPIISLMINNRSIQVEDCSQYIDQLIEYEVANSFGDECAYIIDSLDNLLGRATSKHRRTVPDKLYLLNDHIDALCPQQESSMINQYKAATKLVDCLAQLSSFDSDDELSFFIPERVDLIISYTTDDLGNIDLPKLNNLYAELFPDIEDHHSPRRKEIFISTFINSVADLPKEKRLCSLFERFDELYR